MPHAGAPARLAILISGRGRTLANILDHIRRGVLHASVPLVIASADCPGVSISREAGVPDVRIIPGIIPGDQLSAILREHAIDWVVLAGYLHLLPIPHEYRGRIVNIHPALLPDFGGLGMYGPRVHRAVLDSGARESGCTVHLCDEQYDRGRIILQMRCPVLPGDTPETLAQRVFELERVAYPRALGLLISGRAEPEREPPDPPRRPINA